MQPFPEKTAYCFRILKGLIQSGTYLDLIWILFRSSLDLIWILFSKFSTLNYSLKAACSFRILILFSKLNTLNYDTFACESSLLL